MMTISKRYPSKVLIFVSKGSLVSTWFLIHSKKTPSKHFGQQVVEGGPGGSIAQWIAYMLLDPAASGLYHSSGIFSKKIYNASALINSTLLRVSGQNKA